jgi:hypothetical protein
LHFQQKFADQSDIFLTEAYSQIKKLPDSLFFSIFFLHCPCGQQQKTFTSQEFDYKIIKTSAAKQGNCFPAGAEPEEKECAGKSVYLK